MKKKVLTLASLIICLSIMVAGTLAYFTDEVKVHNIITTNGVDIEIEEWQETKDGLVPYPKDEPMEAMPGTTISKIATVKNLDAEAYIRAKFEVVVIDGHGKIMDLTEEELNRVITLTMNGDDWMQKEPDDGWWYYNHAVDADDSTEPLFTEVVFDGPNMGNEFQNAEIQVIVVAQGVQTANNGKSVLEALGWPKE